MKPRFRAWDTRYKKMINVGQIHYDLEFVMPIFDAKKEMGYQSIPFNDIELMQSTGCVDIRGKEIYEGDIVKSINSGYSYVVSFDKNNLKWYLTWNYKIGASYFTATNDFISCNRLEIIGNIYENKELLDE